MEMGYTKRMFNYNQVSRFVRVYIKETIVESEICIAVTPKERSESTMFMKFTI